MKCIVLYNGSYLTMKRYITVEIKDNKLVFSLQDLGREEYEAFYSLNEEETKKFLKLIPFRKIKKKFEGPEAMENFKKFCDSNAIKCEFSAF